uniref:Uncharacterized protein n=1 Tax=Lepeophtheirus salmonis TaxID=72036 RepID=A0A0K2T1U3_LEPSM
MGELRELGEDRIEYLSIHMYHVTYPFLFSIYPNNMIHDPSIIKKK